MEHIRNDHMTNLNEIQLRALANRNCRKTAKPFLTCPLCGENDTDGPMENHITGHLRSLALKSLPSYHEVTPEDAGDNNRSVAASKPHTRSTIKSFMGEEEPFNAEESDESDFSDGQENQRNDKNFFGDAHVDLGQLSEERLDVSCLEGLAYNRMPWNAEDDEILNSILLERRRQDALKQPKIVGYGWVQTKSASQKFRRLTLPL